MISFKRIHALNEIKIFMFGYHNYPERSGGKVNIRGISHESDCEIYLMEV